MKSKNETRVCNWRRQWHPTPVLLPGKSHGQRSLVGCSPWGHKELDMTERLHFHFHSLEKEMATCSSVRAWRIPGMGEPGGLPSVGPHRVGHDWRDLAAAAAGCVTGTARSDGSRTFSLGDMAGRLQPPTDMKSSEIWKSAYSDLENSSLQTAETTHLWTCLLRNKGGPTNPVPLAWTIVPLQRLAYTLHCFPGEGMIEKKWEVSIAELSCHSYQPSNPDQSCGQPHPCVAVIRWVEWPQV